MWIQTPDGIQIYYEDLGNKAGIPIIFNHGNGNSLENWKELGYLKALEDEFRIILLDCRGFGQSGKPHEPEKYSAEKVTSDFIAVLNQLEIDKCVYYGNSRGGRMAYLFQQLHPERFSAFIIGGAAPPEDDSNMLTLFRNWLEKGMAYFTEKLETDFTGKLPNHIKKTFLANDAQAMRAANVNWPAYRNAFINSDTPCLVFVGELDPIKGRVEAGMKEIKNGEFVILPKYTHIGACYNVNLIAPMMKKFIRENIIVSGNSPPPTNI